MTDPGTDKAANDKPINQGEDKKQRSPEEIRDDIDQTREDLGDTAAALAGKADVKGQAKAKVEDLKSRAQDAAPESVEAGLDSAVATATDNPVPMALAAGFAGGLVVGWILGR